MVLHVLVVVITMDMSSNIQVHMEDAYISILVAIVALVWVILVYTLVILIIIKLRVLDSMKWDQDVSST